MFCFYINLLFRTQNCNSRALYVDGRIVAKENLHAHETNLLKIRAQALEYEVFKSLNMNEANLRSVISRIQINLRTEDIPVTEMSSEMALKRRLHEMKKTSLPSIKTYSQLGNLNFHYN